MSSVQRIYRHTEDPEKVILVQSFEAMLIWGILGKAKLDKQLFPML